MGYFLGPLGKHVSRVMGYFLGPLGKFVQESWAIFWTLGIFFRSHGLIFVGLSTTRAGESANCLQTGSEVRFESADPAVRYGIAARPAKENRQHKTQVP